MASVVDYMNIANSLAQQNNQWSAQQAQKQMDFQREMSNSAHQREVADLKAAGLNPVLSAQSNGASSPSGAMGGTDNSNVQAVVSLLTEFGESIAQATAKGAASGGAAGASYGHGSGSDSEGSISDPGTTHLIPILNVPNKTSAAAYSKEDHKNMLRWNTTQAGIGDLKNPTVGKAVAAWSAVLAPYMAGKAVLSVPGLLNGAKKLVNSLKKAK